MAHQAVQQNDVNSGLLCKFIRTQTSIASISQVLEEFDLDGDFAVG
jgi:hypothetical protein